MTPTADLGFRDWCTLGLSQLSAVELPLPESTLIFLNRNPYYEPDSLGYDAGVPWPVC